MSGICVRCLLAAPVVIFRLSARFFSFSYKHGEFVYPKLLLGTFIPADNKSNDYHIDRVAQRSFSYTGIKTFPLQERSASYYQPIYTWCPLKVGLMNADAAADMLQVEDDSFPLEYSLEAVARVHDLTGGQPFLVQLLGDSLGQRFNRHLCQQLDPPSPVFTARDVDAVVADENFYQ